MPLQLRANLHWCDSGGRAVFLDIDADRYFCLPAAANDSFLRWAAGDLEPGTAVPLRTLVANGILVDRNMPAAIRQPPLIEAANRDWAEEPSAHATGSAILRELVWELHAARLLRTRSFAQVIEAINRRASLVRGPPRDLDGTVRAIAAASKAAALVMRIQDRCLARAIAVQSICVRRGIRPTLAFGVIAHPFAAHCWVQLGSAVLVGGFEQARLYTPILVLE